MRENFLRENDSAANNMCNDPVIFSFLFLFLFFLLVLFRLIYFFVYKIGGCSRNQIFQIENNVSKNLG